MRALSRASSSPTAPRTNSAPPAGTPAPPTPSRAGDAWGGLAAMLVALPAGIAYGVAAYAALGPEFLGHGVRAGILGVIVLGLTAAWIGGAPRLISAPCAPAAAVLAALAATLMAEAPGGGTGDPERVAVLLTVVALMAGALQVLYGALGGGRLIKYIPYPVVSGYLTGVGVIIFLSQVRNFLGLPKDADLAGALFTDGLWRGPSVVVGSVTIATMLLARRLTKTLPATLFGLTGGLAAYFALSWFRPEMRELSGNPLVIGPVVDAGGDFLASFGVRGSALAGLQATDFLALLIPALTLSLLLSIDTLKTCVVLDALTRSRHRSNRELLGQGAGNLLAALAGGMSGAGTMGATLVNVGSGGRTRASGMLAALFALAAVLMFGRWLAWIPLAGLAGIMMVVSARMCDWRSVQLLRQRATVMDFAVIAAVVLVAVSVNLIAATGVGLSLSILLFIREQISGSVIRRRVTGAQVSSKQHRLPEEQALLTRHGHQTTICELQGSLFFGTTDQLFTELEEDLQRCRYLILDLRLVRSVDFTAAHLLEQFETRLAERGGFLLLSRIPASVSAGRDLAAYFAQVGVIRSRKNVRRFASLDDAQQWVEDRILAAEAPRPLTEGSALDLEEFEIFHHLGDGASLAALRSCVAERTVAAGDRVFRRDDTGDELFLIRRGIVRVALPLKDGSYHSLAFFGRGNFFGEMGFLDGAARSADAFANTPVSLYVLSRVRFEAVCQADPATGREVFARLSRALALRLRHTDAELQALYDA